VKVTRSKKGYEIWEETDGYHAFTDDAVYSHKEGLVSPIIIFFEGLVAPVGSSQSEYTVNQVIATFDMIRDGGGKLKVSSMFWRGLGELRNYIGIIMLIGIFALAAYYAVGGS
jgi:hypothetical protein